MDSRAADMSPSIDAILKSYELGPITSIERMGGTAGATVRVGTADGSFVLRLRGTRTSAPEHVAFDAELRRFLRRNGFATAVPLPTIDGADGVPSADGFWELTRFVAGYGHRPGDERQLAAVARTLAELHRLGMEFRAGPPRDRPLHQFALSAPGTPSSPRIDDPRCMRVALKAVMPRLEAAERTIADRMMKLVDRAEADYGGPLYDRMDRWLIHGDFHPSNVLFDDSGEVAGVFDFDWAVCSPRVRDLADAVWFFAGSPLRDGSDIWALTAARKVKPELARAFLREYGSAQPVAVEEARALPGAWLARWIAIHLEGMFKVPPGDRGRFLTRDMDETVEQMLSLDVVRLLT